MTQDLRDAIIHIGLENLLWGYKRIVGELKKLGLYVVGWRASTNEAQFVLNALKQEVWQRKTLDNKHLAEAEIDLSVDTVGERL